MAILEAGTMRTDTPTTPLKDFWNRPQPELLEFLHATPGGLTSDEAKRRLRLRGSNSLIEESRFAALTSLLRFLVNPLVIILFVASGISLLLGDSVGGLIIIGIVLLSVLLNFFMEFQAQHAVERIRKQVATTAAVMRDGREQELPVSELNMAS
jgi:Mg2+-importing ATPase